MKISKALVEHYAVAFVVASVAIWQTGQHSFKKLAWAAAIAVFGPVISAAYNHLKSGNTTK
jgi:hypothetical protein